MLFYREDNSASAVFSILLCSAGAAIGFSHVNEHWWYWPLSILCALGAATGFGLLILKMLKK